VMPTPEEVAEALDSIAALIAAIVALAPPAAHPDGGSGASGLTS
jgi:hypothetical protein